MATVIDRDLIVRGSEQIHDADVVVNGWVEISQGRLVCKNLTCLGLSIESGGVLECEQLLANFVEVDNLNNDTSVSATWVRARVVDLVQLGMEDVVNRGDVTADYCQHFGGDLNPSWDYVRGKPVLLSDFVEPHPDDPDAPMSLDVGAIRNALALGQRVFRKPGPLLTLAPRELPREKPTLDETVDELVTWLKARPGTQRDTLAALAEWLPRLVVLPNGAKLQAGRAIRRSIKSPKLREKRDEFLREVGATKPNVERHEAPAVVRLVRAARPAEYLRPRPDAWLDEFAGDTNQIEVYNNPEIKELPARIAEFASLTRLAVSARLSRIDPALGVCKHLESLDLRGNQLEMLPASIGQLQSLQTLNVESNRLLARLPDSLCDLNKLRNLSLGHTSISELPANIGRLSELHYLSLHGCSQLLELPESFFDLPALGSLYLHGTRLRVATLDRIRKTFPDCNYWNFFQD